MHLNPARARLLKAEQKLSEYRWSSWPEYLKDPKLRLGGLRVDRYLGEMGIPQDSVAGREELERRVEERRAAEEDEEFKSIRRGWCLGDEAFRKELLERAESSVGENHLAQTRHETAEEKARRILLEELVRVGWTETDLAARPKGDQVKIRIAKRLRNETTMTLRWIAELT